jgi:hypothetical protein
LTSSTASPARPALGLSGLRVLKVLLDENHKAWRSIGERSILGKTTLRFLLDA